MVNAPIMTIDTLLSPLGLIIAFFAAIIVSYYTVYQINKRYEFSTDRPGSFKWFKGIYASLSFLATFLITILMFGSF